MLKEGDETGVVGRPDDFGERTILATACLVKYKLTIPTVIDYMDGKVDSDYSAKPVRTTIVDLDGNVGYYAGRGPFDFKIPKIEKALKKIIAGGGYMPADVPLAWGEAVDGIRCGVSIDPAEPAVGEEITVRLVIENVSEDERVVFVKGKGQIEGLSLRGKDGEELKIEEVLDNSSRARRFRKRSMGLRKIEGGKSIERLIDAKIVGGSAGSYEGRYRFAVSKSMVRDVEPSDDAFAWVGKADSGLFRLDVIAERAAGCMDCHSKSDYHHKMKADCSMCHVGEMDTAGFGPKKDACICCHKREGKFGRRKIFGAGGDFDRKSKHISGMITDDKCLKCHFKEAHGDGKVVLVDPKSDGKKAWAGDINGFCLGCHEGRDSLKSGHGKKAKGKKCTDCHHPHGADKSKLLKN